VTSSEDRAAYDRGIARLVARVRQINEASKVWTPTPKRKELTAIAERLAALAELLGRPGAAQFDIEAEHDRPPPNQIGLDGRPVPVPADYNVSYKAVICHMGLLADSARRAAKSLPHPNEKRALPFAALALLHLRRWHGLPCPSAYQGGEGVGELQTICEQAGVVLSKESYRRALTAALKDFDPYWSPYRDAIDDILFDRS
jgi:hypothetical protein